MKNIDLNDIFSESDCIPEQVLFDYQDNKLSGKNKYIVEKHIANCEICSDALEGLALIASRNKIRKSIKSINSSIDKHTFQKKQPTISMSMPVKLAIAATIAILIGISFLFTQYLRKHNDKILAENNILKNTNKENSNIDNLQLPNLDSGVSKEKKPQNTNHFKKIIGEKQPIPIAPSTEEENTLFISKMIDQTKEANTEEKTDLISTKNNTVSYQDDMPKKIDSITTASLVEKTIDKESREVQIDNDLSGGISGKDEVYNSFENEKTKKKKITKIREIVSGNLNQNESNKTSVPASNVTSITTNDTFSQALDKFNAKDYIAAKKLFAQVLINDKSNYEALYYKSVCSFNLEDTEDAINGFNEVLKIENGVFFNHAKWYKALALIKKGENKEAKKILEEIIKSTSPYKINAEQKIKEI